MRILYTLLLGAVTLHAAARPTRDSQTYTPQTIQFVGAGDYSDDELAKAAGLAVGQTYTADDLKQHAQQLVDIGLFDKVSYKFDDDKLTYTVKLSPQRYP